MSNTKCAGKFVLYDLLSSYKVIYVGFTNKQRTNIESKCRLLYTGNVCTIVDTTNMTSAHIKNNVKYDVEITENSESGLVTIVPKKIDDDDGGIIIAPIISFRVDKSNLQFQNKK